MNYKTIRISESTYKFLASKTQGFETADQVVRRLLKVDSKQMEKSV